MRDKGVGTRCGGGQGLREEQKNVSWLRGVLVESRGLVVLWSRGLVVMWSSLRAWLARMWPGGSRRAIRTGAKPALQSELSLDQVKVLRSDLSDADLEVAPVKRPGAMGSAGGGGLKVEVQEGEKRGPELQQKPEPQPQQAEQAKP